MPWKCPGCGQTCPDALDDCPTCSMQKTSWTVVEDRTRDFVLPRKRVELLSGAGQQLRIRLAVDPTLARSQDDRFTLRSRDGSYQVTRTVAEDLVEGDRCVDLLYSALDPELDYDLEIDPGAEGDPYFAFEAVSYGELMAFAQRGGSGELVQATAARIVPWSRTRELAQEELVPNEEEVLTVHITPRGQKADALSLVLLYARDVAEPTDLGEGEPGPDGRRIHRLLFVAGDPKQVGGILGVRVVDVSEPTDQGFAPSLELSVGGKRLQLPIQGKNRRLRWARGDASARATFVLRSVDGAFEQVGAPAGDVVEFSGLEPLRRYSLAVREDGEERVELEDLPYAELLERSTGRTA